LELIDDALESGLYDQMLLASSPQRRPKKSLQSSARLEVRFW
jgi:hypothetical protein